MVWIIVESFTFALVDWKRDAAFAFLREEKAITLHVLNLRMEFVRELSLLVIDTVDLLLISSRLSKLHK